MAEFAEALKRLREEVDNAPTHGPFSKRMARLSTPTKHERDAMLASLAGVNGRALLLRFASSLRHDSDDRGSPYAPEAKRRLVELPDGGAIDLAGADEPARVLRGPPEGHARDESFSGPGYRLDAFALGKKGESRAGPSRCLLGEGRW